MTTPRTLAECRFVTGYRSASFDDGTHPAEYVIAWILFIVLAVGIADRYGWINFGG